eukprot:SAG31_NODE_10320_length_1154_cov_1.074882_1_plen_356_part_01
MSLVTASAEQETSSASLRSFAAPFRSRTPCTQSQCRRPPPAAPPRCWPGWGSSPRWTLSYWEVLAELKSSGLSAADRAKVRLLVGDREHLRRLRSTPLWVPAAAADGLKQFGAQVSHFIGEQEERASDDERDLHREHEESASGGKREWTSRGRQLQGADSNKSEMSPDTIVIVLSVLVGVVGYVVQAYTARRAERAQQQQVQELHTTEQARQREHQMMTAQIERTHQGLDQCCRPVLNDLHAINWARTAMVQQLVGKFEVSHPNVVAEMLSFANGVTTKLQPDGTVRSSSDRLYWTPNPPIELTRAMGSYTFAAPTGAAFVIAAHDFFIILSQPCCFELPTAILEVIGAEPTGEVA